MSVHPIFCFDSSSLMLLCRILPPDIAQPIWNKLAELVNSQYAFAPREVRREIEAGDDALVVWAKANSVMFRNPTSSEYEKLTALQKKFPDAVDHSKEKFDADPWVVAFAIAEKDRQAGLLLPEARAEVIVVAEDGKIRHLCGQYQIKPLKLVELFRLLGIEVSFKAATPVAPGP